MPLSAAAIELIEYAALFGPFAPHMRSSTYPACVSVWPKAACPNAPCCWHDDGFPEGCPGAKDGACKVLDAITADAAMGSKREGRIVRP